MRCPFCHADDDKVVDSRSRDGGRCIRRRRECLACSRRFTTYERTEETVRLTVIKRDGTRTAYDGYEVARSIEAAARGLRENFEAFWREAHGGELDEDVMRKFDELFAKVESEELAA